LNGAPARRVALVTGAGVGIGRAIALALARCGADTALTHFSHDATDVAEEIEQIGRRSAVYRVDATVEEEVVATVRSVRDTLGPVDILVNNAGGLIGRMLALEMETDHWRWVIDTNLTSALWFARECGRDMRRGGRIVNISSLAAATGGGPGAAAYATAKAGLIGLTRALANELAPRAITVNALTPGFIAETPFHETFTPPDAQAKFLANIPLGRAGVPDDVAAAVAWLTQPGSDWITGQTIAVNGGQHYA
jgi:3-oxoacyl-[acyl-carrier protein] reductase